MRVCRRADGRARPAQYVVTGRAVRADVGSWLAACLAARLAARLRSRYSYAHAPGVAAGDGAGPPAVHAAAGSGHGFAADVDAVLREALAGVACDIRACCMVRGGDRCCGDGLFPETSRWTCRPRGGVCLRGSS